MIFNNEDYLRASLQTIVQFVDKILLLDGSIEGYPTDEINSNTSTLEIIGDFITRYKEKIIYVPTNKKYPTLVDKFNAFFTHVVIDDWLFIIDGDEIPFGELHFLKQYLQERNNDIIITVYERNERLYNKGILRPRLIHYLEDMQYEKAHFILNYNNINLLHPSFYSNISPLPIWLLHFHTFRDENIKKDNEIFKEKLGLEEYEFINKSVLATPVCQLDYCKAFPTSEVRIKIEHSTHPFACAYLCQKHKEQFISELEKQPSLKGSLLEKYNFRQIVF